MSRRTLRGGALAALLMLGACSGGPDISSWPLINLFDTPRQLRGQLVQDVDLDQVVPGVSSRSDVVALLGSPSATGTFDDGEWYYIGAITRQRPGRLLGIEDQRVVVVRFDPRGTVRDIRRVGPEEGHDVAVVSRTTPSPGNDRTVLQQLFGNIGRVGPGVTGGQQLGPGAASPGSSGSGTGR